MVSNVLSFVGSLYYSCKFICTWNFEGSNAFVQNDRSILHMKFCDWDFFAARPKMGMTYRFSKRFALQEMTVTSSKILTMPGSFSSALQCLSKWPFFLFVLFSFLKCVFCTPLPFLIASLRFMWFLNRAILWILVNVFIFYFLTAAFHFCKFCCCKKSCTKSLDTFAILQLSLTMCISLVTLNVAFGGLCSW